MEITGGDGGRRRFTRRRGAIAVGSVGLAAAAAVFANISSSRENPVKPDPFALPEGVESTQVNGVEVLRSGKEGPNILFLHNGGQVPIGMTEHIKNLSEVGQVIAPNIFDLVRSLQLRGNGQPSFADIANEISRLDVIDKKQKTGIVSSSMGGSVAWEYTLQNTDSVEWNVAGSPTGWPLKRSLVGWMAAFVREFVLPPNPKIPQHLKDRDPGSGRMEKRAKEDLGSAWHTLMLTTKANQIEQLKAIQTPVDLLWGESDQYVPLWSGREMAKMISNSRLDIVSPYNHLWMAVEPEQLTNPAIARARAMPGATGK